jgi:hypothetical protein
MLQYKKPRAARSLARLEAPRVVHNQRKRQSDLFVEHVASVCRLSFEWPSIEENQRRTARSGRFELLEQIVFAFANMCA